MFKRTFLATAIGAAMMLGSVGSASALQITAGNYKISFDNYDAATLGYGNTSGIKCQTVGACNAVASNPYGLTSDAAGIVNVSSIQNVLTGVTEYIRGTASTFGGITFGPYLTGVFGGLEDHYVQVASLGTGSQTLANSVGGFFNIFSNNADWDPTQGPTGGNLDLGTYTGITGGNLLLGGVFATGAVIAGDLTSSYTTSYNSATFGGSGQGFLDFTSGSALSYFDRNSIVNANGGKNDAYLLVAFDDVNQLASSIGWSVKSVGQVSGQVPEPGTIALLSLAMLGMGAVTRRRNKKGESQQG